MRPTIVLSLAALLAGLVVASSGFAQQPSGLAESPAPATDDRTAPNILFRLVPPLDVRPNGAMTRDDVQHTPPPKPDRLSDSVRMSVTVDDPRCEPGEDEDWQNRMRMQPWEQRDLRRQPLPGIVGDDWAYPQVNRRNRR